MPSHRLDNLFFVVISSAIKKETYNTRTQLLNLIGTFNLGSSGTFSVFGVAMVITPVLDFLKQLPTLTTSTNGSFVLWLFWQFTHHFGTDRLKRNNHSSFDDTSSL